MEEEIKIELGGPADHARLREHFTEIATEPPRCILQTNYYMDTADLALAGELIMFRLRQSDRLVLTYKSGTRVTDGFFRSEEVEAELPPGRLEAILSDPSGLFREKGLDPVRALADRLGELPLELVATLENERRVFTVEGRQLELDRMRFADGSEEYELEIECSDAGVVRAWCEEKLAALGISSRSSTATKFQRVLRKMS